MYLRGKAATISSSILPSSEKFLERLNFESANRASSDIFVLNVVNFRYLIIRINQTRVTIGFIWKIKICIHNLLEIFSSVSVRSRNKFQWDKSNVKKKSKGQGGVVDARSGQSVVCSVA